jgi:hypothetical protein
LYPCNLITDEQKHLMTILLDYKEESRLMMGDYEPHSSLYSLSLLYIPLILYFIRNAILSLITHIYSKFFDYCH